MSPTHSEMLEYYHNKGQEDYPDYDPPKNPLYRGHTEEEYEYIEAYDDGWQNAKEAAEAAEAGEDQEKKTDEETED